jgi:hypothetical protein
MRPKPHRALVADITKTALAELVAFRPTHLIFDFIDERFDLLSVSGALATHSWELEVSGYRRQRAFAGARAVARLGGACERLWRAAALELAALIAATPLRDARLILHAARWAEATRAANGDLEPMTVSQTLPGQVVRIADHNALLERYERWFLEILPQAEVVAAPAHRLADAGHQWGPSPFHYVPEYYAEIARQLEALGITSPGRTPAEPSAPAA